MIDKAHLCVRYRVSAIAFTGVAAVLFFHPGAMDMDRIKTHLILMILLPVLSAACGPQHLLKTASTRLPPDMLFAAILVFFLAFPVRPSLERDPAGCVLLAWMISLILLSAAAGKHTRDRPLAVPAWLTAAGAAAGCYALLQCAGIDPFYKLNPGREAVSTLGNTNELAEIAALLIPMALALFFSRGRLLLLVGTASLPFILAGIWVSGGRAGALAALAGVIVLCIMLRRAFQRPARRETNPPSGESAAREHARPFCLGPRLVLLACMACAGMLLGGLLGSKQSLALKNIESDASVFSPDYPTNKVRIEIWKSTIDMIGESPFQGAGAGRFVKTFPPFRSAEEARIPGLMGAMTEVETPHNEYLWAAAEGGVFAALAFACFLFFLFRRLSAAAGPGEAGDDDQRLGSASAAGTVAAFAVLSLFSSPLHHPASAVILFLAAAQGMREKTCKRIPLGIRHPVLTTGSVIVLLLFSGTSIWLGGRGFISDWKAASVGIGEKVGPEEFETLKSAADMDPANIGIISYVGQIAGQQWIESEAEPDPGDPLLREAKKRLQYVLRQRPYHPGALKLLSRIQARCGDLRAASLHMAVYREIIGERGDTEDRKTADLLSGQALLDRASALFEKGDHEAAAALADRYLQADPLDGDALYLLGQCLKKTYGEGEKDVFRRMHLAYALDWIGQGGWKHAASSVKASLRYGEGMGEAFVLEAIIACNESGEFEPPAGAIGRNMAFFERLKLLAEQGKLPEKAAEYVMGR